METLADRLGGARRALIVGIGGGGDAVGSLAAARKLAALGVETVVGGVAWERLPVDPRPGPRPQNEITGGRPLGDHAVLIEPPASATTPDGVEFCESRLARHLGSETVLIDVAAGAPGAAQGLTAAADELGCELVALVDIGGDAIGRGGEPGLASPLCDAVMIAAGASLAAAGRGVLLCVLGAGCDGEMRPALVLGRVAELAARGAWIGSWSLDLADADAIERAAREAITEASVLVARCARGEVGEVPIRGGRRTVELGPAGAIGFVFDIETAVEDLPLAAAVADLDSIEAASEALGVLGVRTELDYERENAGVR